MNIPFQSPYHARWQGGVLRLLTNTPPDLDVTPEQLQGAAA